jgi:hypothetical protein
MCMSDYVPCGPETRSTLSSVTRSLNVAAHNDHILCHKKFGLRACNTKFSTQYEERVSIHTIICKMLLGVFVSTVQ